MDGRGFGKRTVQRPHQLLRESARPRLQGTEYQSGYVDAQLRLEGGTWLHGESLG